MARPRWDWGRVPQTIVRISNNFDQSKPAVAMSHFLDPDRLIYHRGRVMFALEKESGEFKHVMDVPNGSACGCVCEECSGGLIAKANLPEEIYQRESHFAHLPGSSCAPSGEPGVVEALRQTLALHQSIVLPTVAIRLDPDLALTTAYEKSHAVNPSNVAMTPGYVRKTPDLIVAVNGATIRVRISLSPRISDKEREAFIESKTDTLLFCLRPDPDGKLYMSDLLEELRSPRLSSWLFHRAAANFEAQAHAAARKAKADEVAALRRSHPPPRSLSDTKKTGTFYCGACNSRSAEFIPDSSGSRWGKCGSCGAPACPITLS